MAGLIVNLFGGPGTGKSTTAARAFAQLKLAGINCELAREFAKELVWDDIHFLMNRDPVWVFAEQHRRLTRLVDKVDVIITDAPLLLYAYYQRESERYSPELDALILHEHRRWPTLNFWIERQKPYRREGRVEDRAAALKVDKQLLWYLNEWDVVPINVCGDHTAGIEVSNKVMDVL